MAEYIEREALINWAKEFYPNDKHFVSGIMNAPTADVTEVRHGKWIKSEDDYYGLYTIKCSLCREEWCFEVEGDVKLMNYNYCPNCGAKMDGGNNNA